MELIGNTSGLQALRDRLDVVRSQMPAILGEYGQMIGDEVVSKLSEAAPHGTGGGESPEGDASGPLSQSFSANTEQQNNASQTEVTTSQPTKLKFVTEGTGLYGPAGQRIYPKEKQALYWEGADHPVRSVSGQHANDFVSPVLDGVDVEGYLQQAIDEMTIILENG